MYGRLGAMWNVKQGFDLLIEFDGPFFNRACLGDDRNYDLASTRLQFFLDAFKVFNRSNVVET